MMCDQTTERDNTCYLGTLLRSELHFVAVDIGIFGRGVVRTDAFSTRTWVTPRRSMTAYIQPRNFGTA